MNKALMELMIPYKKITASSLKPEQAICIEFANTMRQLTLENKMPYVWFHVPNEFLPSSRINYSFDLKQKHMGKFSGIPDYCFIGKNDSFFIELKAVKRKQSPNQKVFEEWCIANKVPCFLCFSAKQGTDIVLSRLKTIN